MKHRHDRGLLRFLQVPCDLFYAGNSQVKIQFHPQKIATKSFSIDSSRGKCTL